VGTHHRYAECSAAGVCDRTSGTCGCFAGYEGKACQRTVCPNLCSGHGQCAYIENLPYQTTTFDWYNNYYPSSSVMDDFLPQQYHTAGNTNYWDNHKTRGCVCDPEWGDVDCSKRICAYGTDIMAHRPNLNRAQIYDKQIITFTLNSASLTAQNGNTFALTFKSKANETYTTLPIVFNHCGAASCAEGANLELARDIKAGLEALPNRVVDMVNVRVTSTNYVIEILVEFVGWHTQGIQNFLTVRNYKCGDGCTPQLTGLELIPGSMSLVHGVTVDPVEGNLIADYNSYECGRRGKCDYSTGQCACFAGYTGLACNVITALV